MMLRARRVGAASTRCMNAASSPVHTRRAMHALSSSEIRTEFLRFFEQHGHEVVPSASLIPPGSDTSLLFTNAGMVPFKQVFLGTEQRPYVRATSAQRCVRAGGKHNDLEQVGLTRRHHTQFEMLGNFSFGDYFKEEAILYGWKFLTENLALPVDRLHVTVLHNDDEARTLWRKIAQLPDDKIWNCGEEDNFWAMGDSGPCGPCSEIFWDLGDHIADPDERYLELWNLVFMQYYKDGSSDTTLHALPKRSVDTGMGLERVASVLQGVPSNYHTDSFVPILTQIATVLDAQRTTKTTGLSFSSVLAQELDPQLAQFGSSTEIQTMRIIADHLRASYAMLADGIFPSNIGRGYVLRRIIRRAIRFAQNAGVHDAFLTKIVVPEWEHAHGFAQMRAIIANEERAFAEMLANGKKALERVFATAQQTSTRTISGTDAFRLYDTHGIPLDITHVLAQEQGLGVDADGFDLAMDEHRRRASESSAFTSVPRGGDEPRTAGTDETNAFVGYETLEVVDASVQSVWRGNKPNQLWVVMDPCPFYAEGGGQVGDRGHLVVRTRDASVRIDVVDTKRVTASSSSQRGRDRIALECVLPTDLDSTALDQLLCDPDTTVNGMVDGAFRRGCQVHHSATHLLQSALKSVLGDHVTQAGSYVTTDRLRFDFAHFGALSLDDMTRIQDRVNEWALATGRQVETLELARHEAEQSGAICNFGEKYGDLVRVVRIGDASSEFCGGTHVRDAASIFPFVILSEGSVAAGTRRIEAVAGVEGARYLQTKDATLHRLAAQLETTPAMVVERVSKMQKHIKQLESYAQALGDTIARLPAAPVAATKAVHVHTLTVGNHGDFMKVLRRRAEFLQRAEPTRAHVVVMGQQIVCAVADNTGIHAGKLLQAIVKPLGGRGGGKATFAQGTIGPNLSIDEVCASVKDCHVELQQ